MKKENFDRGAAYDNNRLISIEMERSFYATLKKGIYKELHRRKTISDGQLAILLKTR